VNGEPYEIRFQAAARRAIAERLPESVAAAVLEFCEAALALSPRRVGKPLFGPLAGCHGARRGTYRVVYRIDEQAHVVEVLDLDHRADIYRRSLRLVGGPELRLPGLSVPFHSVTANLPLLQTPVVVEYSAAGFDLGLRRQHDRHPCVSRWLTGCW
jgi:mRNA interferase RelE/StbE